MQMCNRLISSSGAVLASRNLNWRDNKGMYMWYSRLRVESSVVADAAERFYGRFSQVY